MASNSESSLIFLLGGTFLGLITGIIFFTVMNDVVVSIFGNGYSMFIVGLIVTLLVFSLIGAGVGWLFCLLK